MTAAAALFSPPNRSLLAWSRDLASRQPRRLWVASLWFHHVEAMATVARLTRLDPLRLALLKRLLSPSAHAELPPLDRLWSAHLLRSLSQDGLIELGNDGPQLTPEGRAAITQGSFTTRVEERRSFTFLDNTACHRPPHYLHLHRALHSAAKAPEGWTFDPRLLSGCVAQSAAWKQAHQFPDDILAIPLAADAASWQRIVIDHPEQAPLVLIEMADGSAASTLHAFTIRMENWTLFRDAPLFSLPTDWRDVLPDLNTEPTLDDWRHAWLAWSQPHGIPHDEAAKCPLSYTPGKVHIKASKRLFDMLRTQKGEPLKNDACLLAGNNRCRLMALLEIEASVGVGSEG